MKLFKVTHEPERGVRTEQYVLAINIDRALVLGSPVGAVDVQRIVLISKTANLIVDGAWEPTIGGA